MARTPSSMKELGTQAPDFQLQDVVTGKTVSRTDVAGPEGNAGDVHLPALPVRQARAGRACENRARLRGPRRRHRRHQLERRGVASGRQPDETRVSGAGAAVHVSVPVRRDTGRGARVRRAVHAGLFPLRRAGTARLPRPARRQPAGQRHSRDRQGFARGARRGDCRPRRLPAEQRPSLGCNIKWR